MKVWIKIECLAKVNNVIRGFKAGIRNYTIFQVGKATLLRVSDILRHSG